MTAESLMESAQKLGERGYKSYDSCGAVIQVLKLRRSSSRFCRGRIVPAALKLDPG
jgi:hypothetical protein